MLTPRAYQPDPCYPPVAGQVERGWGPAIDALPDRPLAIAIDGPAFLDWEALIGGLRGAFERTGRTVASLDTRDRLVAWPVILERTSSDELPDDPDFEKLAEGSLADLFDEPFPNNRPGEGVCLVFGPGAALAETDVVWYADLPKRFAEAAVVAGHRNARNLGQRDGDGIAETRRLFYVDWPLLDRHRDGLASRIDRWIDARDPEVPTSLGGDGLRATAAALARRPFRTRPTFNTVSWGGHWGQRVLGMNRDARNTGVGYELIAPESGVLVGEGPDQSVEVPFQLLVSLAPDEILGPAVNGTFGTSFPVRFDYLDTVDGGSLSVHCHPLPDYMQRVFGWPYTQHETYYVMVGGERSKVFLGLRGGIDLEEFERNAHHASDHGEPFDIEQYVQTFPATPHQLFAIPAGTPHGSGKGNVVLEVSATPYLYSLRFYDWLRRDEAGRQRPVHVDHAFANLARNRMGPAVADELIQPPRVIRGGDGWREEVLSALPDVFFEVRRIVMESDEAIHDDTDGRFHVLNVVDGGGVLFETAAGDQHDLAYAETIVVPAAVGAYRLRRIGDAPVRAIKALVS